MQKKVNQGKILAVNPTPIPPAMNLMQAEEQTAQEFFGFRVGGESDDPVRCYPINAGENTTPIAVVYFDQPDNFAWAMKKLGTFRMLSRSILISRRELKAALDSSRSLTHQ